MAEYPSSWLAGSRVELGTERESFLQELNENANFGGQSAAGRSYGKDWHCSLKGSQKTDDSAFSKFCGEEPCWRLGNPQMFKGTHPHLSKVNGKSYELTSVAQCLFLRFSRRIRVVTRAAAGNEKEPGEINVKMPANKN